MRHLHPFAPLSGASILAIAFTLATPAAAQQTQPGTPAPVAAGDTAPLRVVRAGPLDKEALNIGNPGALAFDSKREEILVPN